MKDAGGGAAVVQEVVVLQACGPVVALPPANSLGNCSFTSEKVEEGETNPENTVS